MPRYKGTQVTESKRLRLFKLLARHPDGLLNCEIRRLLQNDTVAAMCRDETMHGRFRVTKMEDDRGMRFLLSQKGRRALDEGTVDTQAPPPTPWSESYE